MATFAEFLEALGGLYRADEPTLRGQVRARLQHLQKLGIPFDSQPFDSKVGKGKRVNYERPQIYQVIFCLELAELGLLPVQIVALCRALWLSHLWKAIESEISTKSNGDDLFFVFVFDLMSFAWKDKRPKQEIAASGGPSFIAPVKLVRASEFSGLPEVCAKGGIRRLSLLNVSALVRKVEEQLAGVLPPPGADRPAAA